MRHIFDLEGGFMRRLVLFMLVINIMPVYLYAGTPLPILEIKGSTVIAFFGPVTQDEIAKDADLNESLSDFQYHLHSAKSRLEEAGVTVYELYANSFSMKLLKSTTTFKPKNANVGYYFIMPGEKPKIQYGVMSDVDLLYIANEYFGKKIK
jgi:hypothetical protein